MKNLNSIAYKQVRSGGFGIEPSLAAKRKRTLIAFLLVIAMIVAHQVLAAMGWTA